MKTPYSIGMKIYIQPGKLFPSLKQYFGEKAYGGYLIDIEEGYAIISLDEGGICENNGVRTAYLTFEIPLDDIEIVRPQIVSKKKKGK